MLINIRNTLRENYIIYRRMCFALKNQIISFIIPRNSTLVYVTVLYCNIECLFLLGCYMPYFITHISHHINISIYMHELDIAHIVSRLFSQRDCFAVYNLCTKNLHGWGTHSSRFEYEILRLNRIMFVILLPGMNFASKADKIGWLCCRNSTGKIEPLHFLTLLLCHDEAYNIQVAPSVINSLE